MRRTLRLAWPAMLAAALALGAFLASGPRRLPMDDAYIHLVYGRNLARAGLLTFNLQPPDNGIGTTSILWTLLLAAGERLVGVEMAARVLGMAACLATVALVSVLAGWMLPGVRQWRTRLAAVGVALSGNLLWFSLSGMETMLWLALCLGSVVAWRGRRHGLAGCLLGLAALTRIEAAVPAFALSAVECARHRRLTRGVVVAVLAIALCLAPWVAIVHGRTGHWLPTSFSGKKHAQVRGAVEVVRRSFGASTHEQKPTRAEHERLPWWVNLLYPMGVVGYGLAFVAGGAYLPGPKLPLPGDLGRVTDGLSVVGPLLLLVLFLPCALAALGPLERWRGRPLDDRRAALAALALWFMLHNLAYWLKLPTPGTASRYQVVNHVAFWLLAGVGAWRLRRGQAVAAGAIVLLALVNAGYWRTVYGADCRHMEQVRLAAADYLAASLPRPAVVAAHDIGALGWAGQRRILDLGGLIDPAYLNYARTGRLRDWLREQGATHVVLPTKHSTEATGFYDYAAFLGLDAAHGIRLLPIAHFENDHRDWQRGAAPTWNALPGVTVYRLELTP